MTKIALITGTSTGIGLSAAIMLAQAGFTVIATMRNLAKADALKARAESAGVALDIRQLDVQDQASVDGCVQAVFDRYGQMDLLVNNAGGGYLGSLEQVSLAELQRVMDLNFYGVWRVTQAIFPAMRAAGSGHIITVTSMGGLNAQPFNDAYCAAKFAVEGAMESLAPVAQRLGIRLSLIEPGPVNTEFVANVQAQSDLTRLMNDPIYAPLFATYVKGTQEAFGTNGQTADEVAAVIVEAATSAAPHFRYPTSERTRMLAARKYVDPTGDSAVALAGTRLR
jgi:NAD(P)-dependent dehydrogenase (short-subunit alcohol dehydrogenase family)